MVSVNVEYCHDRQLFERPIFLRYAIQIYQQIVRHVRVNHDKFFGSTACLGFDAEVAAFARRRWLSPFFMHVLGGLWKFFSYKAKTVELRFNGQKCFGKIFLVAFGNVRSYARGMVINPEAVSDDAFLDICVVRRMPKWKVLSVFPSVYKGTHVKREEIVQYRA